MRRNFTLLESETTFCWKLNVDSSEFSARQLIGVVGLDAGATEGPDAGTAEGSNAGRAEGPNDGTTEGPDAGAAEYPDDEAAEHPVEEQLMILMMKQLKI